ncbi:hypothetical protein F0562_018119 [Nyssa sinensis]|uniref:DOG1 domain-containing protein n=1 Tax=Nyssa sinensis TaxID=561372 RepID=A0A5J4ZBK5_9ASTE|nr:hypothetical protein F0562_018119 [Nyssa sinensis]
MASDESGDRGRQLCSFEKWVTLQQKDLSELLQALTQKPDSPGYDVLLSQLVEKNIQHFQDYIQQRNGLVHDDVSAFFAPTWCTSLENSLLWIAGCRPSLFIRLLYALWGSRVESQLTEFLQGMKTAGDLGVLSAKQLFMVDGLQRKTVGEEEKISSRLASLQEDIADQPIAVIAKDSTGKGEVNSDPDEALDEHGRAMRGILDEADQLRLSTLKELLSILTPFQAVDYLAATKKLHLCMHEWGRKRDHKHGDKL